MAYAWLPTAAPDVRRVVAVAGRAKPPRGIEKLNLAANYPAELARIQSLAAMAQADRLGLVQASDSLALFSLRQLLAARSEIARVALLRGAMTAETACLAPAFAAQSQPFAQLAEDPAIILFDRTRNGADLALTLAFDTVLSGAIYGMGNATLADLLEEAQQTARSPAMDGLALLHVCAARSGAEAA
jgi:hypothetical protein